MTLSAAAPAIEGVAVLTATLPLALYFNLPTLWLVVPIVWIALARRSFDEYGFEWGRVGTVRFHAITSALVFVPYALGHYLFAHLVFGAHFAPQLPADFGRQVIDQVLVIALPEEVFFRGYLQTQLERASGRRWNIFGTKVGPGWLLTSFLFAICHIFRGRPDRLIVFFPGLLYGWLRARTGGVYVPVVYHAVSNLLMQVMIESLVLP